MRRGRTLQPRLGRRHVRSRERRHDVVAETRSRGHNQSMPSWLTALLPVFSALLGVLVASQASTRRDTISRLWEQRTDTYLEIMHWTLRVGREVIIHEDVKKLSPEMLERLEMSDELLVRLLAFASDPVRSSYENCNTALHVLQFEQFSMARDRPIKREDVMRMLEQSLADLTIVVRKELSTGSLRLPRNLRRRIKSYSTSVE